MGLRTVVGSAAVLLATTFSATTSSAGLCLRGKALPECKSFLIIEDSYAHQVGGDGMHYAFGEFGCMRNTSARWALGGTTLFGIRGNGASELRGGAAMRVRRWLDSGHAVDFAAGPFLASADGLTRLGGAAEVIYNVGDRIHLTSRWEHVKMPRAQESSLYLGIGLGSKPALIGGGIAGVLIGGGAAIRSD